MRCFVVVPIESSGARQTAARVSVEMKMSKGFEWTLEMGEGMRLIPDFTIGSHEPQFVSAGQDEARIRARYFVRESDQMMFGHVRYGDRAQGPPGFAHGGSIASVLDEIMGMAAWQKGLNVVAAELWVKYRQPTPLWTELKLRAWVESLEGRRAEIRSELTLADGSICCVGGGTFVNIGVEKYREFVKAANEKRSQHS